MKNSLRLLTTLTALILAALASDIGLAWKFVNSLTHPGCTQPVHLKEFPDPEEHWLRTQDGIEIRAWYYHSQNGAAILVFGGLNGSLGDRIPMANVLIRAGYGVVQVDSRACAQPGAPVTLGGKELYDAEAALQFLLTRPEVEPRRIGAFGFSMGGATAIRAAAHHPQIRAVMRDGGYTNLGELLHPTKSIAVQEKIFRATVEIIFRLQTGLDPWEISPIDDIADLSPRPVYLIYGEHEANPGEVQFAAAGEPKSLWLVPGGSHGNNFTVEPRIYEQNVLAFFEKALEE